MSGMKRKKKHPVIEYVDPELNIMPFIDVFSVLNTFLLMSAVFVAFGVLKVQIPFLSNKQTDDKPKRSFSVTLEIDKAKVNLITKFSMAPINEEKQTYAMDDGGMNALHQKLVMYRSANKDTDLATLFSEDDVLYEQLIKVIDAVKLRRETDPQFTSTDPDESELANASYLYPKIVMGSVIL